MSSESGGASVRVYDPRINSLINWVWATLGSIGILIGIGVYNKLAAMNDTLLIAVSKIENQGSQIADLRNELSKQRDEIAGLRSQVYTLEGRTLRGIAEAARAR